MGYVSFREGKLVVGPTFVKSHDQLKGTVWKSPAIRCAKYLLEFSVKDIPSLKLTWPLKMDSWKMNFFLGRPIFRGYVSFREGTPQKKTNMMIAGK